MLSLSALDPEQKESELMRPLMNCPMLDSITPMMSWRNTPISTPRRTPLPTPLQVAIMKIFYEIQINVSDSSHHTTSSSQTPPPSHTPGNTNTITHESRS